MADDLSLLLKIKGDSAGGKAAVAETRAAMATLRTSVGSEMNALRTHTTSATRSTAQLTNGFQALSSAIVVIDGPLGGVASRFRAMGTTVSEVGQILNGAGTQATGMGTSIAAVAGPIGIALAAVAALGAGAVLLTKSLFDLAVSAADFRGKMFDLSQQTGVAVETLSALEIVAKTTGGSIDSIAQSLVIFQGHLDEAQDPMSKMGIKFKELGISITDTESAFSDALKVLSEMPVGFNQTNEAAELFGRRGGKQALAMLKEMDGDLPGTIAKLKELGLVISTEDAKAADEFNDQLAILHFQFRAMLGKDIIPAALAALKSLSSLVAENREVINGFGQLLGKLSGLYLPAFRDELNKVRLAFAALEAASHVLDRLRGVVLPGVTAGIGGVDRFAGLTSGVEGVAPKKVTGADPAVAAVKMAALRLQATLEGLNEEDRVTKRSLDNRVAMFEEYATKVELSEAQRHIAVVEGLLDEAKASQGLRNLQQREIQLKEIDNRLTQENNRHQAVKDELDDKRTKIQQQITDAIEKQNKATAEYVTTVDQYAQAVDNLVESLAKQGVTLDPLIEQALRFDAAMAGARDRTREALKALEDLSNAPPPPTMADLDPGAIGKLLEGDLGPPPNIDPWLEAFGQLKSIGLDAVFSLAQGIGNLAEQWTLYGNVGPNAMRKMVASVLAGVAAQAAVLAVMELAYGIAALTPWGAAIYGPAPFHFKSAALFGGIALGAAALGRAAAGDSFSQKGASASAGGSGGNSSTPAPVKPIDVDRRQQFQQQPPVEVRISFAPGFDDVLEAKIINRYNGGGRLRDTFLNDGQN